MRFLSSTFCLLNSSEACFSHPGTILYPVFLTLGLLSHLASSFFRPRIARSMTTSHFTKIRAEL